MSQKRLKGRNNRRQKKEPTNQAIKEINKNQNQNKKIMKQKQNKNQKGKSKK